MAGGSLRQGVVGQGREPGGHRRCVQPHQGFEGDRGYAWPARARYLDARDGRLSPLAHGRLQQGGGAWQIRGRRPAQMDHVEGSCGNQSGRVGALLEAKFKVSGPPRIQMPRRIVDLSVSLEADIASDPPGHLPEIEYVDHRASAAGMASFFPGLKVEDLPGGEGWALERLKVSTHNGTHLDAPYHFHSTMDGGKRAITIDEVPL